MKKISRSAIALFFCFIPNSTFAQEPKTSSELQFKATTLAQLNGIAHEKASRTKVQNKIASDLLYAQKKHKEDPLLNSLPAFKITVDTDSQNTVLVDIKAEVSSHLLSVIENLGGEIINSFDKYHAIRARVPLEHLEFLAEHSDVLFIRSAVQAVLNKTNTSEGDAAHSTANARSTYNVDGTGVKVGVLSDSVDHLADVQATGDLPNVTVLEDDPGNSGEGTAMLEIVHDLAPGAELYFATAWKGQASFANNIEELANAGCEVIVDDVMYINESPFQDDIISQAVNTVTANGVLYFSSAGNSGNLNDGTSKVWEGDYNASLALPESLTNDAYTTALNFGNGDTTNGITNNNSQLAINLFWSDPLGGSSNDYDLVLLDANGDIISISTDFQNGDDDPYESIVGTAAENMNTTGWQIVVLKYSGEDRFIHLSSTGHQFEHATQGQTRGHATAVNGFGVAAVSAAGMTAPFTGNESVENFSSDGPRRIFYEEDGTAITPGNFSATGGMVRQKPDIAAADGVVTATPGFSPFYGTSAAAPHAAAIGALLRSKKPNISIATVRNIFNTTAFDIEANGFDQDSGAGLIMADAALQGLKSKIFLMALPAFIRRETQPGN